MYGNVAGDLRSCRLQFARPSLSILEVFYEQVDSLTQLGRSIDAGVHGVQQRKDSHFTGNRI